MNSKIKFKILIIFVLISGIVAIFSGYSSLSHSSIESFVSKNQSSSAIIYILLFVALTSVSFSVSVMTGLGMFFFSGYEVIIYSMIGIMGSSMIDFYISRKLGRTYVKNYLEKRGGKLEKFDKIIEKDSFKTIMILSAIFFVPPAIPNFLGGIMKIKAGNYALSTFLGNIFPTIFSVYLIKGFINQNLYEIYFSIFGFIIITIISLYFYKGETRNLLRISFPWAFKKAENQNFINS